MGLSALTFGQIQQVLFTDGGAGLCFWHSIRGSRRRTSGLDAQTALVGVTNSGQCQSCQAAESQRILPRGWVPVSTDSTGNSPTEQEINWKSKTTVKHRSRQSGGGHHWSKQNLPASAATLEHVLTTASPRPQSLAAAAATDGVTGMRFTATFPFLFYIHPLCPFLLQGCPKKRLSPHLRNNLRIKLATLNFCRAQSLQLKPRETEASKLENVTNAAQSTEDPRRYKI